MSDDIFEAPGSDITSEPPQRRGAEAELTQNIIDMMLSTRPWVLFLAILGFLAMAFCVIGGVIVMVAGVGFAGASGGVAFALGGLYMLIGLIYFYPSLYLVRFSNTIKTIEENGNIALEMALEHQRKFWKFAGILAIFVMSFYGIAIVAAIAVPLLTSLSR